MMYVYSGQPELLEYSGPMSMATDFQTGLGYQIIIKLQFTLQDGQWIFKSIA